MGTLLVNSAGTIRHSIANNLLRLALSFSLMLLAASHAAAQYGSGTMGGGSSTGTPGYTPPKGGYGSGKAIGIGVGAAAGAGILFVALHNHGNVTGCIEPAEDGLRLVDAKKNKSYALLAGPVPLKPGERVELKGQKSKSEDGAQSFEARKLVKDLGSCIAPPLAPPQPAGH